ncbi:NlpC/P60 family protein [Aggregatimonas sangjinii]|uniref:NlpC/P60 family protein n=1 Tax=Aggregatimonas sangjinii TaxID=2583587 RepID=A0A5B7SUQ3_9FLAO|nr:C40 family peptidase [Aggregatimonas sangjinii]QCX01902.1 NlpC/P60 family protein [Aggregatimonas sangjinii]
MKSTLLYAAIAFGILFLTGCKEDPNKAEDPVQITLKNIKKEYAPDKRVALFDVTAEQNDEILVLKGESNLPEAIAALKSQLAADSIPFIDSIQQLPADDLGKKTKAIINISVANLRSNPGHSSELATQATLGTIVNVYKKKDNWYYVQTPDHYLAWVDEGGIELVEDQIAENWSQDEKIIYTQTYGHAYADPYIDSLIVSDLTAGNLLTIVKDVFNNYSVRFPDGRNAYVRKSESEVYTDWLQNLDATEETLVSTGRQLMGIPYLWGGTSTKGVDCSGFTKTVYFMNGMVIPRDASQQVHTGIPIDSTGNFDALQRGDLLFFGRKATDSTAEKVVHVGMWIGDNEFIHSSGKVRISSMDKKSKNYDEYNLNRYLRTKRIFKQKGKGLMNLTQTTTLKQ